MDGGLQNFCKATNISYLWLSVGEDFLVVAATIYCRYLLIPFLVGQFNNNNSNIRIGYCGKLKGSLNNIRGYMKQSWKI